MEERMFSFPAVVSIISASLSFTGGYYDTKMSFAADLFSLTFQLDCSQVRKARCSLWGTAIAISCWADTGRRTEAATQDPEFVSALRRCCCSVLMLYVLFCTVLSFIVLGCRGVVRSVLRMSLPAASHGAGAMTRRPQPGLRGSGRGSDRGQYC